MDEKILNALIELEERAILYESIYFSSSNNDEERIKWAEARDTMREAIDIVNRNLSTNKKG